MVGANAFRSSASVRSRQNRAQHAQVYGIRAPAVERHYLNSFQSWLLETMFEVASRLAFLGHVAKASPGFQSLDSSPVR